MKFLQLSALVVAAFVSLLSAPTARAAGIAYGSITNFDTVNDTGHECHGFEIEIEDCHSTDIGYTYNYNHYGACSITEDDTIPLHPKTLIRWASKKNADGTWAAYTAIPSGPIAPTNGHQFTNPNLNFGGEHFGASYNRPVGAVRYFWLIDDGAGNLMRSGSVDVATPTFTYYPPVAGGAPAAQVQAVLAPPEPPEVDPREFGEPIWVKEIRTTSKNKEKMALRDLVSDDPDDANDRNWRNNEPDEVEAEWELLQTEYANVNGANNKDAVQPDDLPDGDEVVTRRYEFFAYTGPVDAVSGEAYCDNVGPDDSHGAGLAVINGVERDLADFVVVGDYKGAQMAAVDVAAALSLTEQVSEGQVGVPYADRQIVLQGQMPFSSVLEGDLPPGLIYDAVTGQLSGTPTVAGTWTFRITASDETNPDISKSYTIRIAAAGAAEDLPPAYLVDTVRDPVDGGTTTGDGAYAPGTVVAVTATPAPGFRLVSWEDNHEVVSQQLTHDFTADINHTLTAHFAPILPQYSIAASALPVEGGSVTGAGLVDEGSNVSLIATPAVGYAFAQWQDAAGISVSTTSTYHFIAAEAKSLTAVFTLLPSYTISLAASPVAGGMVSGGGTFVSGSPVSVTATATDGYVFSRWTKGSATASTAATYSFNAAAAATLTAVFVPVGSAQTITLNRNPSAGGTVAGAGSYLSGEEATIVATPAPNFIFSRWTESDGVTLSTEPSYTFVVTGSGTITARFTESIIVTATSAFAVGGEVEMDSDSYKSNEAAQALAKPNSGYVFVHWTENGTVVSTEERYSFNVTGPRALVGHFTYAGGYVVGALASPSIGGEVTGDGPYAGNAMVNMSAVPAPGFAFVNWSDGPTVLSMDADFNFLAEANVVLTANFAPTQAIAAVVSPANSGNILGEGEYMMGDEVTLQAEAALGFEFSHWSLNGAIVSTSASHIFTMAGPLTYVAHFTAMEREIHITIEADPPQAGNVEGGGDVMLGDEVEIEAEAKHGYTFSHWSEAATCVSKVKAYDFTATRSRTLVAHFIPTPDLAVQEEEEEDPESPHHGERVLDLNWPDNDDGWVLQESNDAQDWCDCPQPSSVHNGRKHTRLPLNADRAFYRLIRR